MLRTLVLIPMAIRLLRWLAIAQQKEYRLDRLWLFIRSSEGKIELRKLLFKKHELTRFGLKRPVMTPRVLFVGVLAVIQFMLMVSFLVWVGLQILSVERSKIFDLTAQFSLVSFQPEMILQLYLIFIISAIVAYALVPLFVLIGVFPTSVIARMVVVKELQAAQALFIQYKPMTIGITGSYGKTSTKQLLAHVLGQKYSVFATPKSHNTRFSVPKSINSFYTGQEIAVLEYAAYTKGEIAFLARWFQPSLVLITGLTPQHVGLFGGLDQVVLAKSELVKAVRADGKVFCNAQDPGAIEICRVGGVSPESDAFIASTGPSGSASVQNAYLNNQGQLCFQWNKMQIETKLIGLHMLNVVQMALSVAEFLKISSQQIKEALESFEPTTAFIQLETGENNQTFIMDDKTSNPMGFKAAIDILGVLKKKGMKTTLIHRGIVDLGDLSHEVHSDLAKYSARVVDEVLYVGEDGKDEFMKQFGEKCYSEREIVSQKLASFAENDAILVEGSMPHWVKKHI